MFYTYLGDRLTAPELKRMQCDPVRRANGKCIRGRNGNMLVVDAQGRRHNVLGRLLRKNAPPVAVNGEQAS